MQPQQNNNPQNQPQVTPNGQSAPPSPVNQQPPQQQYSSGQNQQPSTAVGYNQQAGSPAGPSTVPPQQPANYQNVQQQQRQPINPQQSGRPTPAVGQPQPMQQQGFSQGQQFSAPQSPQPGGMGQQGPGFSYPVNEKSGSKLKKILLISGGAIVAIASLSLGLFVALGGGGVSYDELSRVETSSTSSENISILHPDEMEQVFLGSNRLELRHSDEESQGMISEISVEGIHIGAALMDEGVRDEIVNGLLDSNSDVYGEYIGALERVLDNRSNFTSGDFRRIELVNGKSARAALIADIEFELPLATDQDEYVPAKGNFIYVVGEETLFTVGIQAIEEVFDANEAVFEEIAKSIEVE